MGKVRVIAITNQKGGVGKTTTAINLSACLAAAGKKVLTIDADQQGNTTSGLGLDKNGVPLTIYDVFLEQATIAEVKQPTCVGLGSASGKHQPHRSGNRTHRQRRQRVYFKGSFGQSKRRL